MKEIEDKRYLENIKTFIKFASVGGMATLIHYSIYIILGKNDIGYNIAYSTGYLISFIFNFLASNYFTFNCKPELRKGIKFLGAHVINWLLQVILLQVYIYIGIDVSLAPIGVFLIAIPVNFIFVKRALKDR